MLKIGNEVSFENEIGDTFSGVIKKTKKYVPVREKHEDSVFFEIKTSTGLEYASPKEFL